MRYHIQVTRIEELSAEDMQKNTVNNRGYNPPPNFQLQMNEKATQVLLTEVSDEQWDKIRAGVIKES